MRVTTCLCIFSLCLFSNLDEIHGQVTARQPILPAELSWSESLRTPISMDGNRLHKSNNFFLSPLESMLITENMNYLNDSNVNSIFNDFQYSGGVSLDWERQYAYGLAPAADAAYDIAVDKNGNIYVTGSSTATPYGSEFCTIKYDKTGNQQWAVRYGKGDCETAGATDIVVDSDGNVYVTGVCMRSESELDIATIKYNDAGEQQWIASYNSPDNGNDAPGDIIVDPFGNVYIAGGTELLACGADFLTIKYNSNGEEQWVKQYNGSDNGDDNAQFIAFDNAGNIITTGMSTGIGTGLDFTIVKYSLDGAEQWIANYDGPKKWNDQLTGMTVDSQSNVYMVGAAGSTDNRYDYVIVKFNPQGKQEWENVHEVNRQGYNYTDVAVGLNGHVYMPLTVVDESYTSSLSLFAYDNSGSQLWSRNFDQIPCSPQRVIVDSTGNIFVIGNYHEVGSDCDYVTIKYNPSGDFQWYKQYGDSAYNYDRPMSAVTDSNGNVYITGYSRGSDMAFDYATVKYSSSGDEQWVARYNGPGDTQDEACGLTMDFAGNVYVLGKSLGTGTGNDYLIIKYTPEGEQAWTARYNGPGNAADVPKYIITDNLGYVYTTGISQGLDKTNDYATIKYNGQGEELWASRYTSSSEHSGEVAAMTVDRVGNVCIACNGDGPYSQSDFTVIKYDATGAELWVVHSNNVDGEHTCMNVTDMAVDDSGNIYFTGESRIPGGDDNITTIKYNSEGIEQWVVYYDSPVEDNEWYDRAERIGLDGFGYVYILGASDGIGTGSDLTTIKYNSDGEEQWVVRYDGPAHDWEYPYSLKVDNSANIYIAGESRGTDRQDDYVTVKYDSSGNELWIARYESPEGYSDEINSLVLDNQGSVYVAGSTRGVPTSYFITVKYNKDGEEEWVAKWDGKGGNDWVCGIDVDNNGNVYVAGESWGLGWVVISTVKFVQTTNGIGKSQDNTLPNSFYLYQNFPNPFNSGTTIAYQIPKPSKVYLRIYNLQGKCIRELINRTTVPGNYEMKWDGRNDAGHPVSTGVYFYVLKTSDNTITQKMILLR